MTSSLLIEAVKGSQFVELAAPEATFYLNLRNPSKQKVVYKIISHPYSKFLGMTSESGVLEPGAVESLGITFKVEKDCNVSYCHRFTVFHAPVSKLVWAEDELNYQPTEASLRIFLVHQRIVGECEVNQLSTQLEQMRTH